MSWKTKLYVPPEAELDLANEDHQRILMEREYAAEERQRPKPTLNPQVSRFWWFWRMFGWLVYVPARFLLLKYLKHRWAHPGWVGGRYQVGYAIYDWPGAAALDAWIYKGAQRGSRAFWLRALLAWIADPHHYSTCLHCGFIDFGEDYTIYDRFGEGVRTVELFEFLDGGGVDYFGEANDYHGWQWCYRCGNRTWETH